MSDKPTLGSVRRTVKTALLQAGIDTATYDTSIILQSVLGLSQTQLLASSDLSITPHQLNEIWSLARRRCQRQPLAYLIGEVSFADYLFAVGPGVLVPRPDSEVLVESAFQSIRNEAQFQIEHREKSEPIRLLDTCTGCGCIGIAVALKFLEIGCPVELHLADIDRTALQYARQNVMNHHLEPFTQVHEADLFPYPPSKTFQLITANPPYIESGMIDYLMPEVLQEPRMALEGGADGLDLIRRIVNGARTQLNRGGRLFLEHGYQQGPAVSAILSQEGFNAVTTVSDFSGKQRVTSGLYT